MTPSARSGEITVQRCRALGALPLPLRGEGWGEGVTGLSIDPNPSPQPSPKGRGSRPSLLLRSHLAATWSGALFAFALLLLPPTPALAQLPPQLPPPQLPIGTNCTPRTTVN